MIGYFFLGLCVLVGFLLLAKWYSGADPKNLAKIVPRVVIFLVVAILLMIVFTGRASLLVALAPMALLFLSRFRAMKNRFKAAMGPQPGQTSEVVTRYFRMTLDHDSGGLSGEVLEGSFAGQALDDLVPAELLSLWQEIVADAQSASVMESYLTRRLGPDWQEEMGLGARASGNGTSGGETSGSQDHSGWDSSSDGSRGTADAPPGGTMTPQQAYEILGLEPGASKQEIREAHRRLLQKIHPDHGGSNFLAAQINRAKDLLLKN